MIISDEQFSAAYQKLPFPIREYLADPELSDVVLQIGTAHQLHVDTIGALEREVNNMLLGLVNPTQFVGELKSIGIPETSVGAIVEELNAKIFMPLREKMKGGPAAEDDEDAEPTSTSQTIQPATVPTPVLEPIVQTSVVTPVISYAQAPTLPRPAATIQPPVQVTPPAPSYIAAPAQPSVSEFSATPSASSSASFTPLSMPSTVTPPKNIVAPHVRTMQEDMRISQSHPQAPTPHVDAAPLTAPVRPPAYSQAPVRPLAAPAQLQQTPTPVAMTAPARTFQPTQTAAPAPKNENRDALHAVLKEYGVDPYREPAE